jgi:hypothetical protein
MAAKLALVMKRRQTKPNQKLTSPAQVLLDRVNEVMADPASAGQPRHEWIVQSVERSVDGLARAVEVSRMRFKFER